jgi:hypothetical protein
MSKNLFNSLLTCKKNKYYWQNFVIDIFEPWANSCGQIIQGLKIIKKKGYITKGCGANRKQF